MECESMGRMEMNTIRENTSQMDKIDYCSLFDGGFKLNGSYISIYNE